MPSSWSITILAAIPSPSEALKKALGDRDEALRRAKTYFPEKRAISVVSLRKRHEVVVSSAE
jgi:hypothetical protein